MIDKIKDYLNNKERTYNISKGLLVFALLWLLASVYIDILKEDNGSFIQRSGAIIVLFGVMVEFALSNINFIVKNHMVYYFFVDKAKLNESLETVKNSVSATKSNT